MKIAIIGCGITGMSAGITLQKAGIDTVIYEKMDKPGGVIAVYNKNDLIMNNALEFVYGTAQNTFANDMWQGLGMFKEQTKQKELFKTFLCDDYSVGIYKDFSKTINELLAIGKEDKKRILRLWSAVKKIQKIEVPMISKTSNNILWRFLRLGVNCIEVIPYVLRYGAINCAQYSQGFKSQKLKTFFSEVLNSEKSVLQYIVLWAFFSSGNFGVPENNQQEIVETLYKNYIRLGGSVYFKSDLINVFVENKKISAMNFIDKTVNDFDYVIFSNDIASINKIMRNSKKGFPHLEKAIEKEHITSSCMLYFSLKTTDDLRLIDNLSIVCKPFKVGSRYVNNVVIRVQQGIAKNKQVISVTLYQNEDDYFEWKKIRAVSDEAYKVEKLRVADCVSKAIKDKIPCIKCELCLCNMVTPLTYQRYTGVNYGGWMPEGWNPYIYLFFGRGHMPGVKNASIAGQKTFPIGGTTIGAFSGVKLAEKIVRNRNRKNKIT